MILAAMKIEVWDIDKIIPYDRNVKKHPPEQVNAIANSIKLTNWDQPIVVDGDGLIIKGHGRRLAAIQLGMKKVPVLVRRDLTPEQVKAARLADNRAAMSGIDTEMLREELNQMSDLGLLDGIFDKKELDFALAELGSMNSDPLIDDVDTAVAEQEAESRTNAEAALVRRVSLTKAFGFTDIAGSEEILVTRFMAKAASETGLVGTEALTGYLRQLLAA